MPQRQVHLAWSSTRADSATESLRALFWALPPALRAPVRRVWLSLPGIAQCAISAGIAWEVATRLIGHSNPFFAPAAAVVSLGLTRGQRLRRAVELVAGVTVGVGVGDLLIAVIGSGTWQLMLVVALAMATSNFLDGGPVISLQAGSSAVLVATLLPPGQSGGYDRMVDALIGGVVAVIVVAIFPAHPLRRARKDAAAVLSALRSVITDVAQGLRAVDLELVEEALARARATQPALDLLRSDLAGGQEIIKISPLRWTARSQMAELASFVEPLDMAVRNVRVLARRSVTAVEAGMPIDDALISAIAELARAVGVLREVVLNEADGKPDRADAARALRTVARMTPERVSHGGLSEVVLLAQLRSMTVDLLVASGLSRVSAIATLPASPESQGGTKN